MLIKQRHFKDLSIQVFHSCICVSDIIDNHIVIKRYIGYSEKEAINLFIEEYKPYSIREVKQMKILMIDLDECSDDCFEQIDSKYELLTELNAECYGKVYTDTKEFENDFNKRRITSNCIIKIIE